MRAARRAAPAASEVPNGLEAHLREHERAVLAGLLVLALALAIWRRFVLDDAFISFQYAKSLFEGHGLTWFGVRVEGYSNFLWVLWIALGLSLGADPIVWAHAGSIVAFLAAVAGLWRLGRSVFGSRMPILIAAGLFVTNYSVASFATSGLETMAQTALLCLGAALVYAMWERGSARDWECAAFSTIVALAILTRLDSLLPAAVLGATLWRVMPRGALTGRRLALLAAPVLAIVGAWLAWKYVYYHDLLPNSFHCKVTGKPQLMMNGLRQVGRFLGAYLLWPFLLAAGVWHVVRRRAVPGKLVPALILVIAWFLYVVAVGGDFMEFRFFIPVAPFLYLLVAHAVVDVLGTVRGMSVTAFSTVVLIGASIWHGATFRGLTADLTLDSISTLSTFYGRYPDHDWGRIGRELKAGFAGLDPVIGLEAVGAIPYYSGLRTVDVYGLNDPDISTRGVAVRQDVLRPGHQRVFPTEYLRERRVNFVLGHPTLLLEGALHSPEALRVIAAMLGGYADRSRESLGAITLVALPIGHQQVVLLWYVTSTPALDRRIRERGWDVGVFHSSD